MKYSRCDNINICADSVNMMISTTTTTSTTTAAAAASSSSSSLASAAGISTTNNSLNGLQKAISPITSSGFGSDTSATPSNNGGQSFSDEFRIVEQLYEKWSDCERTVVLFALLKRLRYPCLKFLQYSIDNNLTQHAVSQSTMNAVIADINANNPSYLQNLLNAYNNLHLNDNSESYSTNSASAASSSSNSSSSASDKETMPCYGSTEFQLKLHCCDERKVYAKKEDILNEVLNILPLLKPGNEDAKVVYLSLIPNAVKDTIKHSVPAELVQQIFSYLLIHPAVTSEDRRSLKVWLRKLEEFLLNSTHITNSFFGSSSKSDFSHISSISSNGSSLMNGESLMLTSACSASSSCSLSSSNSVGSASANSFANVSGTTSRSSDWQTIAPPSKHKQQQQQPKIPQLNDWCDVLARRRQSSGAIPASMAEQFCDNFNGITLKELSSSQSNSLGLASLAEDSPAVNVNGSDSSLVNGVVAAAASAEALFVAGNNQIAGVQSNPIINIISNNNCDEILGDDHDTSFSKNGTDFDFEPPNNVSNNLTSPMNQFPTTKDSFGCTPPQPFTSLFTNNPDQLDVNRWSLDSKIAALKTRRSNSLTTQTISTSTSSSNSSVTTANENFSNSTENLAQFANKPRSFSLSIENQQRGALLNGGSETRLDDFKPNYIKFQTRNVGMSSIGAWLKSLRLHKYIELFHNMTYEEMLQITEEYLQSVGVTKGASHKLSICIEKLKERTKVLNKLEQDLLSGKTTMHKAVEDLTNIVLTPMKPVEAVNASLGEENVALMFLRVIDLVCSIVQRDPYALPEDDNLSSIIWILDRSIHCEAFVNHINQLKDLKFQISKIKIAFAPRLHYNNKNSGAGGNGGGAAMNKPRWSNKPRKCDSKNGSNDRINYRKNSGDVINLPLNNLAQQQQQQSVAGSGNVGDNGFQMPNGGNGTSGNNTQYKNSNYSNYSQQAQTNAQPNGRSLNNLIVVSGGPQQPQKIVFKPGHQQGVLSINTTVDNLQMDNATSHQHHQQQQPQQQHHQHQQDQRRGSLSITLNNNNNNNNKNGNIFANGKLDSPQQSPVQQQQQQQPKKTMASVVMVSSNDSQYKIESIENILQQESAVVSKLLIDDDQQHENATADHNLISQQQLQLLAAAAAAVAAAASGCHILKDTTTDNATANCCNCNLNFSSSSSGSNNKINHQQKNNKNNNNNNADICSNCYNNLATDCLGKNQIVATNVASTAATSLSSSSSSSISSHIITQNQMLLNEDAINKFRIINDINNIDCKKNATNNNNNINDINSLEQLETLCLQMTEQAIN